ncbi:MAG TPA: CPBP family intramembrane glutamic endopeptidase [Verrucomicrobiae bacterium]|nr:CPBP family intramembrane glutamic endopeptidase [Verrucomicrobiae bacterium]
MPSAAETTHVPEVKLSAAKSQSQAGFSASNSPPQLRARVSAGQLTWPGPLVVVIGRTALILLAQGLVAVIFLLRGAVHPWLAAAPWWTIYGTLVDIGCLALMWRFTRKEGIRLRDLIGPIHWRYGKDFFLGLLILAVVFPMFALGAAISNRIVGTYQPVPGLLDGRMLPLWATIYSYSLWWMIWSPTEEMTYAGYALPRMQALGRTWLAIAVVGFWWTVQHPFLPFVLEWQNFLWRFITFAPGIVALMLIYLRVRRLAPLILAHWTMDVVAVMMTMRH